MRLISLDRQLKELRSLQAQASSYIRELIDAFIEVAQQQEVVIDTDNLHDFRADAERLPAADLGKTMTQMGTALRAVLKERDALRGELEAAKRDMLYCAKAPDEGCAVCAHYRDMGDVCKDHDYDCLICRDSGVACICATCMDYDKFEWRGAQKKEGMLNGQAET